MFWCLVRLSTGALSGGLYASPLEMAVQSAVACSEVGFISGMSNHEGAARTRGMFGEGKGEGADLGAFAHPHLLPTSPSLPQSPPVM